MMPRKLWSVERNDGEAPSVGLFEAQYSRMDDAGQTYDTYDVVVGAYAASVTLEELNGLYLVIGRELVERAEGTRGASSGLVLARTMPGKESKNGTQPVPANLPPGVTPDMMEFKEGEPVAFMTIVAGDRGCVQFVGRQKFLLTVQRMTVPYKAMVDYVTGYLNASVNAQPPLRP